MAIRGLFVLGERGVVAAERDVAYGDAGALSVGKSAVEGFEREYLLTALRRHGGNISRTAESIGMVRQSLQQKIRELGLRDEDWSTDA